MDIFATMKAEADRHFANIADLPEYPIAERVVELRGDVGYFSRVLDGYNVTVADQDPDFRRVAKGKYLPVDVLLLGVVEDAVSEGDEEVIRNRVESHPLGSVAVAQDVAHFNLMAQEATDWVHYGGGPGARLVVPGPAGKWRLYERNQSFFVPELGDDDEPTGQLVGVPSYNVPSRYGAGPRFDADSVDLSGEGLGKYVDDPGVEEATTRQLGVVPWAGNLVVPALVGVEVAHIQLIRGMLHTRKIELAWYYRISGEEVRVAPPQKVDA